MRAAAAIAVLCLGIAAAMSASVAPLWWGTIALATTVVALSVATWARVQLRLLRSLATVGGLFGLWVLANAGLVAGGW